MTSFTNKQLAEAMLSRLAVGGQIDSFSSEASEVLAGMLERFKAKVLSDLPTEAPASTPVPSGLYPEPTLDTAVLAPSDTEITDGTPEKGDRVVVVKGRKVPHGTVGELFWTKEQVYSGVTTVRAGIKDDSGNVHWTYLKNLAKAA